MDDDQLDHRRLVEKRLEAHDAAQAVEAARGGLRMRGHVRHQLAQRLEQAQLLFIHLRTNKKRKKKKTNKKKNKKKQK
jgi:hypothetical protein